MTRIEDRKVFKTPGAAGVTADNMRRYLGLIEKRNAEDVEFQRKQGEAAERERQTTEWKENYDRVRTETRDNLEHRPDIAADRFLRTGQLEGRKGPKVKLDIGALTDDQRRSIPREYYGRDGVNPDDMAGLFGYQSGDALVAALGRVEQERQLEGLTPQAHFTRLVDAETDRAMRQQYGNLEDNILEAAKEHILSSTQLDLLHEETLHLATMAGSELPIKREEIQKGIKDQFNATPLGAHSTDKYLAAAGRAGQAAEDALLAGDPKRGRSKPSSSSTTPCFWRMKLRSWISSLSSLIKRLRSGEGENRRRVRSRGRGLVASNPAPSRTGAGSKRSGP